MKSKFFFLSRVKKPCGGHCRGTALQSPPAVLLWPVSWSLNTPSAKPLMLLLQLCTILPNVPLHPVSRAAVSPCWECPSGDSQLPLQKLFHKEQILKKKCLRFYADLGFFYPSQIVPAVDSGQSEIPERSIWSVCLYKAIMAVGS